MQYRVYDRHTITYVDGGFVANYEIDDDYIVNNNTTVEIIQPTYAQVGDIIVLIKTSGAYHKGVITEVDNSALKISYKADKELFNDNFPNPFSLAFKDDTGAVENPVAGKFGVDIVASILSLLYADTTDEYKRLPLVVTTQGDVLDSDGNPRMLWTWQDLSIGMVDWLIQLFEQYNVVVSWTIDFDMAVADPYKRNAKFVVSISAITNKGGLVKDNVAMQTITYTGEQSFEQTMCILVDSETQSILESQGKWYLYEDVDQNYYILDNPQGYQNVVFNYSIPKQEQRGTVTLPINIGRSVFGLGRFDIDNTGDNAAQLYSLEVNADDHTIINANFIAEADTEYSGTVTFRIGRPSISERVLPVKTKIVEYNANNGDTTVTPQEAATETLIPSKYNQAVEVKINADSKMFEFDLAQFGNEYTVIGKYVKELGSQEMKIVSIYTGRKESSRNKYVTLLFGLGRKQYTDLIQIRLRKQRYHSVYGG